MKVLLQGVFILFLIGVALFLRTIQLEMEPQATLFQSQNERPSLTFILGEDKPGQHYFTLAEQHFLLDSQEKTDRVIKSCHSLEAMINYLNQNTQEIPWGVINVVVHGNMWGGLSVAMTNEGRRAFPKDLYRTVSNAELPVLSSIAVDETTKINLWACGIGKNPVLNMALEMLFTNADGIVPDIYASPHFVIFQEVPGLGIPVRLKASYWPYFFREGYRPSESEIAYQLRKQYPEQNLDWNRAIQTASLEDGNQIFHEEFNVPLVWSVLYPDKDSRPKVTTEEEKINWIKSQPELMQKVKDLEIPLEKYKWTVNQILFKNQDGRIQPAIKAIGMCTVLCVVLPEA